MRNPAPPGPPLAAAVDFIEKSGAARLPHGRGRSLQDHLRGTMRILSHWAQPPYVVAAGLLHSVYGTDVYPHALISLAKRGKLADVAGEAAERLAYLFCILRRDAFFARVARRRRADDTITVECHQGPNTVRLAAVDIGALLVIHMANSAEQSRAADGSPAVWVSAASRWARWAKPLIQHVPPVFDDCATAVELASERAALEAYGRAFPHVVNNGTAAAAELLTAAERLPCVAEPLVLLGYGALQRFQWNDAFQYASRALRLLAHWGTAWDKRLEYTRWSAAAVAIANRAEAAFADPARVQRMVAERRPYADWREALIAFDATNAEARRKPPSVGIPSAHHGRASPRVRESLRPRQAAGPLATTPPIELPPRFVLYLAGFRDPSRSAKHNVYPGLPKRAVYPAAGFSLARELQARYADIKAEFVRLPGNDGFQQEPENIGRTGQWSVFMLYELGKRNDANCARCPVTTAVIERYAAVHSICNAAYFSILAPNTHVAPHKGPTNMRLRCHLGIDVPERCGMRVDGKLLAWREGKCLVFDDSFTHEVWNEGDRPRVALVVDMWHPDLSQAEVALLNELQRYAFAHAKDMSGYWARGERARTAFRLQ